LIKARKKTGGLSIPTGAEQAGKVFAMLRSRPSACSKSGMKHQHHFGSANNVALRDVARISTLISDLDRQVRILDHDIAAVRARLENILRSTTPD
jgi:hypothetical protein